MYIVACLSATKKVPSSCLVQVCYLLHTVYSVKVYGSSLFTLSMISDNGDLWCDNMYLCSLYFVLTTFTQNGVGDIMPKKHSEVSFL